MIIKRNRKIGILRYMADILPNHTAGILKFFFLLISQGYLYNLFNSVFSDNTWNSRMNAVLSIFSFKERRDRKDFF